MDEAQLPLSTAINLHKFLFTGNQFFSKLLRIAVFIF